ncbi:hypothetical protein KKB18_12875, partial [bacterium]|nr:hypothetical protein [bacterium]
MRIAKRSGITLAVDSEQEKMLQGVTTPCSYKHKKQYLRSPITESSNKFIMVSYLQKLPLLCNLPILSIKFPSIRGVSALADGVLLLIYLFDGLPRQALP